MGLELLADALMVIADGRALHPDTDGFAERVDARGLGGVDPDSQLIGIVEGGHVRADGVDVALDGSAEVASHLEQPV